MTRLSQRICSGQQRQRQSGQARREQDEHFGEVAAEEIEDELADVVEDDAPFLDRRGDRLEAIVLEHDGRGVLGDVGAADAHGDADVRLLERGRIVHAVAEHRDDLAPCLQRPDDGQLVLPG